MTITNKKIICKFKECSKKTYKKGYCKKHWKITKKMICVNCGTKLKIFITKIPNFCSEKCVDEYYKKE